MSANNAVFADMQNFFVWLKIFAKIKHFPNPLEPVQKRSLKSRDTVSFSIKRLKLCIMFYERGGDMNAWVARWLFHPWGTKEGL